MARQGAKRPGSGKAAVRKQTLTQRSGLVFPVRRMHRRLRAHLNGPAGGRSNGRFRVGNGAAVYATAVLEYLTAELMELSGNACRDSRKRRITPRHLMLAVRVDDELNRMLKHVIIPAAGVVPHLHAALIKPSKANPVSAPPSPPPKRAPTKAAPKPSKAASSTTAKAARTPTPRRGGSGTGITTLSERVLQSTGAKITVLSGDIVNVRADAFVVPSSGNFSMSGQVAQRASQVGGVDLRTNMAQLKGAIPDTQARLCTAGGHIAAPQLMLCNGPSWSSGGTQAACMRRLIDTVLNCLALAHDNKMDTLALPSIGSGVASFPKQLAAQMILQTISDYFKGTPQTHLKNVFFVLHDQQSVNIYVKELKNLIE